LWFSGRHNKGVSLYMEEPRIRKFIWYSWGPCSGSNSEPFSVNAVLSFREKLHKLLFKSICYCDYFILNKLSIPSTKKLWNKAATNLFHPIQPVSLPLIQNCCVKRQNHAKHFPLSCVQISLVIQDGKFLQTEQAGISSCGLPQFLHANSQIMPLLGQACFLPNHFQFTIYLSPLALP
jgi:hypothetical protein